MGEITTSAAAERVDPTLQEGRAAATIADPVAAAGSAAALLIADHLSSFTYDWMTERELQDHVAAILAPRFTTHRERPLSPRDRPDFTIEFGGVAVAVEIKIAGAHNAVLRQLGRYAEHDGIAAVVLASGRRTLLAGIPALLHSKPIAVALLAGAL